MDTNQKIVIVTHETFYGVPHALRDYLLSKKVDKLIFIGLPFIEQRKSSFTLYKNGDVVLKKQINQIAFGLTSYILDFFLVVYWMIKQKEKYNLFIGIDVLNGLTGLFLKKLGRVDKFIFYAMDFAPIRFSNNLLNFIYHKIEEVCVKNADEVWNVSPRIAEGRDRFLHIDTFKYPQKVVNSGIWIKKIKRFPFGKVKKHQLLFLGHVLEKQGLQMVLQAIPIVVEKIPDFKFLILGGGEYEDSLRKLAERLKIKKHIEFKGWIKDRKIIDATLGESAAAIVAYIPEKERIYNFSYYGDPIKIKEYLASGLPVILTDVPHNAKEIERKNCGIVIDYNKEEISRAIIALMSSELTLRKYRENAFKYAKEFDWNVIFSKALS
ncbi:MAG: glycosyltransferase [Candidatus Levybacteria bacterium]|nr:glycosyltransferase [Candidatus Levybacteria bacterium]